MKRGGGRTKLGFPSKFFFIPGLFVSIPESRKKNGTVKISQRVARFSGSRKKDPMVLFPGFSGEITSILGFSLKMHVENCFDCLFVKQLLNNIPKYRIFETVFIAEEFIAQ